MKTTNNYARLGVSSSKADVHKAIRAIKATPFHGTFARILPDIFPKGGVGNSRLCSIQHTDGAGTVSSLGYLFWVLSGSTSVWAGLNKNSMVMNYDDLGCSGALGPFVVNQLISRNAMRVNGEIVEALVQSFNEFCEKMTGLGFPTYIGGGETQDVGDLVRTIMVDHTFYTKIRQCHIINCNGMKPPALIVGFSSTGKALWEEEENSGIGSNGLTLARHVLLHRSYRSHTETYAPELKRSLVYRGKFKLQDNLPGTRGLFSVHEAMLSPTRTYLPLIRELIQEIGRKHVLGFIHCSGGGQTKIRKFGQPGTKYVKNNLFPVPPIFRVIQRTGKIPWREMYEVFNMGHRLEMVVADPKEAEAAIQISEAMGIQAKVIGHLEKLDSLQRRVQIESPHGVFIY